MSRTCTAPKNGLNLTRVGCAVLAGLVLIGLSAAPNAAAQDPRGVLEGYYERWRTAAEPWLSDAEGHVFRALDGDVEREIFLHRFWEARNPTPEVPGHSRLAGWQRRFELAQERFESLKEDRARALMIAGKPSTVLALRPCDAALRAMEVWTYTSWHVERASGVAGGEPFVLLFIEDGPRNSRRYRQWSPGDGAAQLTYAPTVHADWTTERALSYAMTRGCLGSDRGGAFEKALANALDPTALRRRMLPPQPSATATTAWLDSFLGALHAAEDAGVERAPIPGAALEVTYPGRYTSQSRTIVRGRLTLPTDALARNAAGQLYDRLVLRGDVRGGGRAYDAFAVTYYLAGAAPEAPEVTLDLFRRLRPGRYLLRLRVEDRRGLALLRVDQRIEVPELTDEAPAPAGYQKGFGGLLRPEVGVLATFPSIEVLPLTEPLAGRAEVEAVTTGGPIDRVELRMQGEAVETIVDREPPWTADFDFGSTPERRQLEAVAFDPAGRELARHIYEVNAGPRRFAVRLELPEEAEPGSAPGRARAVVDVPADEMLERLEIYLDDTLLATLDAPPFELELPTAARGATFVRAMAVLASGVAVEDLVVLDHGAQIEEIDVRLVEVYASVVDGSGRPLEDLEADEAKVLENGEAQPLVRFDRVENLPINVALMMDSSASMRHRIGLAAASARRFFEQVLTEKDRASLLTFHHAIHREVPFTNDIDLLHDGTSWLRARGTTRLHDSLVWALHGFGGLEGKRALIVLSDGLDVDSDFDFKQVREMALRGSVAVYPILLEDESPFRKRRRKRDPAEQARLAAIRRMGELASATGGRHFELGSIDELDRVYRRIELDLRSQYLFVYAAPTRASRAFRKVDVEVSREGAKARAVSGYYP